MINIENRLKAFENKGLCGKSQFINRLVPNFMEKARHNLTLSKTIEKLSNEENAKKALRLPDDFYAFDWVIITAYYAMYHSALAALASIDYKSDNHTATMFALEVFFVHKELLEPEFLEKLKQAGALEAEYVQKLRRARRQRETAQYAVTEETGKEAAERLLEDTPQFINRMEILIEKNKTAL